MKQSNIDLLRQIIQEEGIEAVVAALQGIVAKPKQQQRRRRPLQPELEGR